MHLSALRAFTNACSLRDLCSILSDLLRLKSLMMESGVKIRKCLDFLLFNQHLPPHPRLTRVNECGAFICPDVKGARMSSLASDRMLALAGL